MLQANQARAHWPARIERDQGTRGGGGQGTRKRKVARVSDFFVSSLGPQPDPSRKNPLSWSRLVKEAPADEAWSAPEAFVTVLLAAVTCDGGVAAPEHEELLALVHRSRALKSLTTAQLSELNIKAIARLRDQPDALAEACAALPEDMRLTVFAHALDLVLADGELSIDEADFLNALLLALKLNREDVAKIADVIVLKNKY